MDYKLLIQLILCFVSRIVCDSSEDNSCRDSFAILDQSSFSLWTCSRCYTYLFPKNNFRFNYNTTDPALTQDLKSFYRPTLKDPGSLIQLCEGLGTERCVRWKSCCEAADRCCNTQIATRVTTPTGQKVCPQTWDGWSCFSEARPGTKITKECPEFLEYGSLTGHVEKECTENGTWGLHPKRGPDERTEWTDYSRCVNIKGIKGVVYAAAIASSLSLILLVPAIFIFLVFRQLRSQQRIKLHVCLFLSFVLTSSLQLIWILQVYNDRISHPWERTFMVQREGDDGISMKFGALFYSPVIFANNLSKATICKAIYILHRYARCTNFFWMFCEGLFLHRLLVQAFKCPSTIRIYFLIGWGCPTIPVTLYMIVRILYANETCWVKNAGDFEWIVYTPNLACILLNLLFLLGILRILLTQLHQHPNEPSNYRRALKATFVLVPLFGLQLFLVIYRPSSQSVRNIYEISSNIIIDSQGGLMAIVFCYLNGEVATCLKGVLRKVRFQKSNKSHSFATSYSVVAHNKAQEVSEYIPMQQKADGNANI